MTIDPARGRMFFQLEDTLGLDLIRYRHMFFDELQSTSPPALLHVCSSERNIMNHLASTESIRYRQGHLSLEP